LSKAAKEGRHVVLKVMQYITPTEITTVYDVVMRTATREAGIHDQRGKCQGMQDEKNVRFHEGLIRQKGERPSRLGQA